MNESPRFHRLRELLLGLLLILTASACAAPRGVPNLPSRIVGHCAYTNQFSRREECREYLGDGWTDQAATDDCRSRGAAVVLGAACGYPDVIGYCALNVNRSDVVRIWMPGNDASLCGSSRTGCEFFGGGQFVGQGVCANASDDAGVPNSGLPVFRQPTRTCREPLAGEPAGNGPNGQVCTWNAISASTEPGRHFEDYASCDTVRTQRPYYARPPADQRRSTPDPRLEDPAYVAESNWVRGQIESSGCICCHSSRLAPNGPSNWYVEAPGNWLDTFYNSGLALGAGWIDSSSFGAYPAEQNNGFARTTSGFPSTDPERMARFFRNELSNRGLTQASFADARPFGGPIYDQTVYQPTECTGTEGVTSNGTVQWSGGAARYVYLLRAGSANPGVPPNLDLPQGTIWRLDVPFDGNPMASGIRFGEIPNGVTQRFPQSGAPEGLVGGERYYIYVLQDVGIPVTRCLFTYPR